MNQPNKVTFKIYQLERKLFVESSDEEWIKTEFRKLIEENPYADLEMVRLEESDHVILRTKKGDSDE